MRPNEVLKKPPLSVCFLHEEALYHFVNLYRMSFSSGSAHGITFSPAGCVQQEVAGRMLSLQRICLNPHLVSKHGSFVGRRKP
jgi:hypothetical protein